MILQSVSASFDFSQPPPRPPHCPCGNFAHLSKTHFFVSLPWSKRRRKQLLIANFPRKSVRRKWGFSCCAVSPDAPGSSMNIELTNSARRGAKNLVIKRLSGELEADEFSQESPVQMGNNFTSFQEDPFVDKLRTQLGVIHPIPSPRINRNIAGLFVFFFFVGVAFDKLWTSRKKSKLGSDNGRLGAWPQVPTSFSLFLEKDLQRKESVEWVNMVLGKLWKVYRAGLENWLIGLLQPVIDNLKKPDYVERVEIKQFSLGDEPLSVRNVERRTSRRVNDLQYQIGLRYTGGARMLLMLSLKFSIIPIYVPVGVRDFDIDGELWVKLRLIPTSPWVGAVQWAFVSLPKIKFELSPFRLFNLMDTDNYLLLSSFFHGLGKFSNSCSLNKGKAVGPVGVDFKSGDIQEGNKDFVGELSVTLVDARKLSYVFYGKTDPYVTLSLGDQIIRSKKNSQTTVIGPPGEPIWNQDFDILVANPKKQKLYIQVNDSLGFTDLTIGTGEVDLGSLQDTVPTDRIVVLQGGWGLFKKKSAGEILLRLTYKAYVEDEDDDKTQVASMDTDASDSDDELSDSVKDKLEPGNEADKESFMDVLAALIVSEEFQGIVASETGNAKLGDDISIAGSKISKLRRGRDTESVPSNSNNNSEGSQGVSVETTLLWLSLVAGLSVLIAVNIGGSNIFNP
ncbi:hypothetical protein DVH24_040222 [Malus domestica]|uniref:C2 domain-containing protein n=1 Tax=Malus domestica TaxID=3750 RepID=A0A498IAT0_MALDO|nr:hypothetical protein DVH24_040222 [Malus domestica]